MSESVSVVIPAYNAERFIGEAIESVLAQTHPPLEIVVVDDGSTDGTAAVAAAFPRVDVQSISKSGVSFARNVGVAATTGAFIAFLDADDYWRPEKLLLQLRLASRDPEAGIIMSRQTYRFDVPVPRWFRGPRDGASEPGFQPSNWFIRRETWDLVGGFAEDMTHSEDTDWLARARDAGARVAMVDEPLVTHRIHDRNASGMAHEVRLGVLNALRGSVQRKRAADA